MLPSSRPVSSLSPVKSSELPFISREWLEGRLLRPDRPVNPPPMDFVADDDVSFDDLVSSFQHFDLRGVGRVVTASQSAATIESSADSDSG